MNFYCNGCETTRSSMDLKRCVIPPEPGKEILRFCRHCVTGTVGVPDVYWDGKEEHGLADDERTGKPRVFSSKAEKAAYLKERGLQEAGDKVRGSYPTIEEPKRRDSREDVRRAIAEVKKMSPDYRRQKFFEITKRGR